MKKIEQIAKVCHEVNRAYCQSIGDNSQTTWEKAPKWQKESAKNGVLFHITNPRSKPCDSHNNWLKEKKTAGWVYGKIKDAEKKTHPCMVTYSKLPKNQRVKDSLFIAVVRSFE